MKGILILVFALIMMLIVFNPENKKTENDPGFNTFSYGPAPVDIYVSIKSSASEYDSPSVQPVLSDNNIKPEVTMKDDLIVWN